MQTGSIKTLQRQLHRLKFNPTIFNDLVARQPKFAQPDEEHSIVLGNLEADHIITVISDPYCAPCSRAHNQINQLLNHLGNTQFRIVFNIRNDMHDKRHRVAGHLMRLNTLQDKKIVINALHDWYDQEEKDYDAWSKKYPISAFSEKNNSLIYQSSWCEQTNIRSTPTFLLNGNRLPDIYHLQDIKYLLT